MRFVICVDTPSDNVSDGYKELRQFIQGDLDLGWETSDEAYYDDGTVVPEFDLTRGICKVLDQMLQADEAAPQPRDGTDRSRFIDMHEP